MALGRADPDVSQWVQQTMALVQAAADYANAGVYDAETDGLIRQVRVVGAALNAALNSIQITRPMIPNPGSMNGPPHGPASMAAPATQANPAPAAAHRGARAPHPAK
jgi:hypothetical protein